MRVKDKSILHSSAKNVGALQKYMTKAQGHTFDDIRADVSGFDDMSDGEIHQIAIDAGLEVEPG